MPYAVQHSDPDFPMTDRPVVVATDPLEFGSHERHPKGAGYTSDPLDQRLPAASMAADGGSRSGFTKSQKGGSALYTVEQRQRRDQSPWTLVQGVLAPVQFAIFLTSLVLVVHYLVTGNGFAAATISIVVKTLALYAIMITGAIWERAVFGCYLFARAFFWEDVFSMLVLALHTLYLIALARDLLAPGALMLLALAAYASYLINAAQFILKLRAARLQRVLPEDASSSLLGAAS